MTDPGTEQPVHCPGCGTPLEESAGVGGRRYRCPSCAAVLCGIAVLRHMIGVQPASALWERGYFADNAQAGGPCVFCARPMTAAPVERGRVWICKVCETVWADEHALAALSASPAGAAGGPAAGAGSQAGVPAEQGQARCENCGAPVEDSWDEKCPYCGAALRASTRVVVLEDAVTDRLEREYHHDKAWKVAGEILGGESGRLL